MARRLGRRPSPSALAAVAYEAFSGERAQAGNTPVQVAHSITDEPAPRCPPGVAPGTCGGCGRAAAGALSPNPGTAHAARGRPGRRCWPRPSDGSAPAAHPGIPSRPRRPAPRWPLRPCPPRCRGPVTHQARRTRSLVPLAFAAAALGAVAAARCSCSPAGAVTTSPRPLPIPLPRRSQRHRDDRRRPPPRRRQTTPSTTPTETTPSGGPDSARASRLNDRGYALLQSGYAAGAVPILQQAAAAFPADSTELNHAFALFNLARQGPCAGPARPARGAAAWRNGWNSPTTSATRWSRSSPGASRGGRGRGAGP